VPASTRLVRSSLAAIPPGKRPLLALTDAEITRHLNIALDAADGVAGAHCVHELWMRGGMSITIAHLLDELWRRAGASLPDWMPMRFVHWLPRAYEEAARFGSAGRGRSNVYLVLLDYRDRGAEEYGAYVGMSRYDPAARFDQHKAGIRAAGSVLKRGLEVLTGPVLHLRQLPRQDAERIEKELAEALEAAGVIVQGGH
jgi:hypothetical protein